MRPVREITMEEENYRNVEFAPGMFTSKKDPVKPEPEGTIVLMAFRITGYDPDCDGSLMARLEHIDKDGETTGWAPHSVGLYKDTDLVVTAEEWRGMFPPNVQLEGRGDSKRSLLAERPTRSAS